MPSKQKFEKIKDYLWKVTYLAIIVFIIGNWFFPSGKQTPNVGDKCGENHHWELIGTPLNQDMSCIAD